MEIRCSRCDREFTVAEQSTWWDYKGSGYDTKLTRCPLCGQVNIVKYIEEPDRTAWFYEYRRK